MKKSTKLSLAVLRVAMGWVFFYAGITKVLNPDWTSAGYLNNASTFPEFFAWLASPNMLPWVDFLNEWGLTLIGISLIIGFSARLASLLGIALMILYWLPALDFPMVGEHSLLIDDHIIYALVLWVLYRTSAGRFYGLGKKVVFKVK